MKKEDYTQYKKWELIIMISILKTIKFCNCKVGEFFLSFILIALPLLLFAGPSKGVWLVILLTHSVSLLVVGRLRSDEEKLDFDDELNREINSCKLALKQKKNK